MAAFSVNVLSIYRHEDQFSSHQVVHVLKSTLETCNKRQQNTIIKIQIHALANHKKRHSSGVFQMHMYVHIYINIHCRFISFAVLYINTLLR